MTGDDTKYKIAFASVRGMGRELAEKILDILPSEADFMTMTGRKLADTFNMRGKIVRQEYRQSLVEMAEREISFMEANGVRATYFTDPDFPQRLQSAPDSPIILYYKGDIGCLGAEKAISIVGTRHATHYGQHFCSTLLEQAATSFADLVTISGLAYGIDVAAHRASIAQDIPTAAVLAHGLNTIYPSQHWNVAKEIVRRGGVLVSDYNSQMPVVKGNFLARNRIVAALSDCTVVVESAEHGGAMSTASIAASYNRDVFALPGRISDPYSAGCNKLIRECAASLITGIDDLAKLMRWAMIGSEGPSRQMSLFSDITPQEKTIIDYLRDNPGSHVNTLGSVLEIPMPQLLDMLIDLEFKGAILAMPGNKYSLA